MGMKIQTPTSLAAATPHVSHSRENSIMSGIETPAQTKAASAFRAANLKVSATCQTIVLSASIENVTTWTTRIGYEIKPKSGSIQMLRKTFPQTTAVTAARAMNISINLVDF